MTYLKDPLKIVDFLKISSYLYSLQRFFKHPILNLTSVYFYYSFTSLINLKHSFLELSFKVSRPFNFSRINFYVTLEFILLLNIFKLLSL